MGGVGFRPSPIPPCPEPVCPVCPSSGGIFTAITTTVPWARHAQPRLQPPSVIHQWHTDLGVEARSWRDGGKTGASHRGLWAEGGMGQLHHSWGTELQGWAVLAPSPPASGSHSKVGGLWHPSWGRCPKVGQAGGAEGWPPGGPPAKSQLEFNPRGNPTGSGRAPEWQTAGRGGTLHVVAGRR